MRKKTAIRCITSLLTIGIAARMSAADITIALAGKSTTVIYIDKSILELPANQTRWDKQTQAQRGRINLQAAVQDLQTYLQRITGATIPILEQPPQSGAGHYPILIGGYATKTFGPPAKQSKHGQAWRLVVSKQGTGMIGETEEAISYAIYEFLHQLGCRWFMPGELGEIVPVLETLTIPELDISGIPSTIKRNISGINLADSDACNYFRRNRLGGGWLSGGHALNKYISKSELQKHPEWIAKWDGKREMMRTTRNCWGNPEVAQAIADEIIKQLDKHYVSSVSLAPADGMVFCQCEKCKALDADDWDSLTDCISITDRLINFCNRIVAMVTIKYPDVLFNTLAYVHYTQPPVREKLHPNIVISIAPITFCRNHSMLQKNCPTKQNLQKILKGWAKAADKVTLRGYAFNLAEVTAPNPMISKWSDDLKLSYNLLLNNEVIWQPEAIASFESVLPGLNLGIRMAFDSSLSPEAVLTDFYDKCYGPAAGFMREYWETIDTAWGSTDEHTGSGFGYHLRFSVEVMTKARYWLNKALDTPTEADIRKRLQMADSSFREFELFMTMRRNFLAGKFKELKQQSTEWMESWSHLNETYASNYAFSKYGLIYFKSFFYPAYNEAYELTSRYNIIPNTLLRNWKYRIVDKEDNSLNPDWILPRYNDQQWKTTDICRDTWSSIGLHDHFGIVQYRSKVKLPKTLKEKKVYLWISSTDGSCQITVNGTIIPYIDKKGKSFPLFTGYCTPVSFDITSAIIPGRKNLIAITCERTICNEIGTGGLMGPVLIYQDK